MIEFILLHTLDGRDVFVNAANVTMIGEARADTDPQKKLVGKVHCVVNMVDGKFVTVAEQCDAMRQRLKGAMP